jgi:hypothetical protein
MSNNKVSDRQVAFTEHNVAVEKRQLAKRFVDFKNNKKDRLCLKLLAAGKANYFIHKRTGYSDGQIRYRALWADIDRSDYRNGIIKPYTKYLLGRELTEEYDDSLDTYLESKEVPGYEVKKL